LIPEVERETLREQGGQMLYWYIYSMYSFLILSQ
jgi:hypothetical protein